MSDIAVEDQVDTAPIASGAEPEEVLALQDLLVEDVSIDGMCGVY